MVFPDQSDAKMQEFLMPVSLAAPLRIYERVEEIGAHPAMFIEAQ